MGAGLIPAILLRSFFQPDHDLSNRGIHSHFYNNTNKGKNISFDLEDTPLLINHYAIQSKEFWINIKMTRGDVNYWYDKQGWERNIKLFDEMDVNDIEDNRLKIQNEKIQNL